MFELRHISLRLRKHNELVTTMHRQSFVQWVCEEALKKKKHVQMSNMWALPCLSMSGRQGHRMTVFTVCGTVRREVVA